MNTVSLLKSEVTKEKIKPKKLIITKNNCKKVKDIIFVSNLLEFLKFLIEKNMITKDEKNPKIKE